MIRFRRLWAMARKESLHIRRDPYSLILAIAIPVVLLTLFGVALTLDVDDVPLAIWDQSDTPVSRELVSGFRGSAYFHVSERAGDYPALIRRIDDGRAKAALIVPPTFAADVQGGRPAAVQLLVDGSDGSTATLIQGYAEAVVQTFSQQRLARAAAARGTRLPPAVIELRPRVWYNPELESKNFIIPGLIAMIMAVIAALLTSLTVAREWETGTMEQLISTPIRPAELVLGKLAPYFVIGMLDVGLAVLLGEYAFAVPLRGSLVLLFGLAAVFLVGTLAVGITISIVTRRQLLASQIAMLATYLPAFLLSGLVFTIANMPLPIRVITRIVPARYFVTILRGIYLKGAGLTVLWQEVLLLAGFGTIMLAIAIRRFRKTLA